MKPAYRIRPYYVNHYGQVNYRLQRRVRIFFIPHWEWFGDASLNWQMANVALDELQKNCP